MEVLALISEADRPYRSALAEFVSTRVDQTTGAREEVTFFGAGPLRMFGCLHRPPGDPVGGVVICSPLQSEFLANYRREFDLSRALARRGFASARFHYRGTGHSDGETPTVTFGSMLDDALAASRWLAEEAGVLNLGFVGTRWSGLIAAAAAAQTPGTPLVLWEPVTDGSKYFRDLLRLRRIHHLNKDAVGKPSDRSATFEELKDGESMDILGFSLGRAIYESGRDRTLIEQVGERPGPVLLIQVDRSRQVRTDYVDLIARLNDRGAEVRTIVIQGEEPWWFPGARWQEPSMTARGARLVRLTSEWLETTWASG